MRTLLIALSILLSCSFSHAEEQQTDAAPSLETTPKAPFTAFTGRVSKNKVRMRSSPSFDGSVMGELNSGDLLLVLGEADDFFAVQPPADARGYIFRTFVLDNVVEGTRVNVRLKPDTESPVIAQLNSGDRVEGAVISNNKWLEIKLPSTARFYVAKDYVEKAGDAGMITRQAKRREDLNKLMANTEEAARTELQKPFNQMNIEPIKTTYNQIITNYADFPDSVQKAKGLLANLQEAYLSKKMAYLESQANNSSSDLEQKNKKLTEELQSHKTKITSLEQQLKDNQTAALNPSAPKKVSQLPVSMAEWLPKEENLFLTWSEETNNDSPSDYYQEQKKNAVVLRGIVEPYNRPVKNKPGDFMLVNSTSKLPIAFLYSTQVNLQQYTGHEVSIQVAERPNNNYAFPAYFVLSVE